MIVSLIAAISADGFIAKAKDQSSLEWTSKEDTAFFVEKTKELGTVIFGRTTFETIGKPLKGRRTIVMTQRGAGDVEGVEYTNASPKELLQTLQAEGVETVAVCGGAYVWSSFLEEGLIDEFFLTVEPIVFGSGVPLFRSPQEAKLILVETRRLGEGGAVLLHYKRA